MSIPALFDWPTNLLALFNWPTNPSTTDVKMDWSVLKEKATFKMLGFFLSRIGLALLRSYVVSFF